MAEFELPRLVINSVATTVEPGPILLVNRSPAPGEVGVPINSVVSLELIDVGNTGIDLATTQVRVDGQLAFDGTIVPPHLPPFAGTRASVSVGADSLVIVLDPVTPFASKATITISVASNLVGGGASFERTYAFEVEDRTAPKLVAAVAIAPRVVRLAFDEPVAADASAIIFRPTMAPAVPIDAVAARASSTILEVTIDTEMTPDAIYVALASGVIDSHGNSILPPFDSATFQGFRPARHPRRRFDLWSMLPKHNRRADVTGDLARFIACIQEVTDLLLAEVDRFSDLWDLERTTTPLLDLILHDLGNPFPFELDDLGKRRLASVLVEMYQQKGTGVGIRNAIRFFLGIEIEAITGLAETSLELGISLLGVDWELGPSDRFARYAFDIRVGRVLTDTERKQLRTIVNYMKPAHTHFVHLLEPTIPVMPDHWEIGLSEVGTESVLH